MSAAKTRILPVGDAALTVELGRDLDPSLNARVRALDDALRAEPFAGLLECVPAYASLLVVYDPRQVSFAEARAVLEQRLEVPTVGARAGARHEVPVRYGGEDGPDLSEVALRCGLSEDEVVARHTSRDYTALFVGFLPGFAYLGTLPRGLERPRRASPRPRVPAGSVAVAGRLTGVYPAASPGGWNLIGRTDLAMFDPRADPPARVQPGDRVRFVRTDRALRPAPPPAASVSATPSLEVIDGGLLTTVQDGGRRGHRRVGVPLCGALDPRAMALANLALGNPHDAALLECTASGLALRFLAATRFAVAGADLGATLERSDLGPWPVPMGRAALARAGNVLSLQERRAGLRAFIAFAGGIDVAEVLGARATDLMSGFGGFEGRALRAGDRLGLGRPSAALAGGGDEPPVAATPPGPITLRIVMGPQDDMFTAEARVRLASETYEVGPLSDRTACRLLGTPLQHEGGAEILTDGMVPGCIQVPGDGRPIVMLADAPTTGGYPKIATVITADLPALAQLAPGDRLRFAPVSLEEARAPS